MRLNTIKPARGSNPVAKRVGRGPGSGNGKTSGRGTKGQGSRAGSGAHVGFEGGQMPLQRRLPKYGFGSRTSRFAAEVRLGELARVEGDVIDLEALRGAGLIGRHVRQVKIFASGNIDRAVRLAGVSVTKGARAAIEAAGGSTES